jgi:hypothetical protein
MARKIISEAFSQAPLWIFLILTANIMATFPLAAPMATLLTKYYMHPNNISVFFP